MGHKFNPLPFSLSDSMGRREFLKRTGLSLSALTVAGSISEILSGCATEATVTHGTTNVNVGSLTNDGSFIVDSNVKPDGTPILVVRQSATAFIALSMRCTHEDCQVDNPIGNKINCSCHGSQFDMSGNVMRGPASTPLTKYSATFDPASNSVKIDY